MENQPSSPYTAPEITQHDRTVSMWMHLAPFLAYLFNFMIPVPFLSLIAVLILYFSHREKEGIVLENGKESLNFQITLALIWILFFIIAAVFVGSVFLDLFMSGYNMEEPDLGTGLSMAFGVLPIAGFGMLIWLVSAVLMVVGSVRANNGKVYRYPLAFRFVK